MNNTDKEALSALLDKESRREIMENPKEYAQSLGMDVEGKEVVVVVCDKNTMHIPIPSMTVEMAHAELNQIHAGAGTASTAGSASTVGSVGTVCYTISSVGSASSVGTAGTAE